MFTDVNIIDVEEIFNSFTHRIFSFFATPLSSVVSHPAPLKSKTPVNISNTPEKNILYSIHPNRSLNSQAKNVEMHPEQNQLPRWTLVNKITRMRNLGAETERILKCFVNRLCY